VRRSHPVRRIRTVLGKTQPEFAELVGTSAIALKRVENETLGLSTDLASRITAATGAATDQLLKGRKGKALGWDGEPYTLETYRRWNAHWSANDDEAARRKAAELAEFVLLVCRAAATAKHATLRCVYSAIATAIDEVSRSYGLDATVAGLWEHDAIQELPVDAARPKRGSYKRIDPTIGYLLANNYHRRGRRSPVELPTVAATAGRRARVR
jgi:transcriptional regulator with XRE-family HTH domain